LRLKGAGGGGRSRSFGVLRLRVSRSAQDDRFGGFKEQAKAVAELGDGVAEDEQAGEQSGAGEVESVAGGIEVAFEGCGLFAAEGQ
jgi:hypothetical protein